MTKTELVTTKYLILRGTSMTLIRSLVQDHFERRYTDSRLESRHLGHFQHLVNTIWPSFGICLGYWYRQIVMRFRESRSSVK